MTYEQYKQFLTVQGMTCMAHYMGTGTETGCHMFNPDNGLNIEVSYDRKSERVTADASVTIPGLMNPVSTGRFSQPWSNGAFINQCRRLTRLKRIIGEQIREAE